ncbi:unnamed protein product [Diabrotica balteata]|uniref:Mos1 transposase HTH domain-containing protein n=1 Tax=Diabrotica balteata TaxID=107213 RepID=A0A9N9T4X4_DIABA|nr:unnamed protein product [Diabrotica balteata]
MEKIKHRPLILEIYERILKVYKDSSPSRSTVERWVSEFKSGYTSIEDDPDHRRPKTATSEIVHAGYCIGKPSNE